MPLTPEDIREFQAHSFDWEGKPLAIDGLMGERTAWALRVSYLDPRRCEIVRRACNMVGTKEEGGANRGVLIDAWNKRCGTALGSPWCASFVSWVISCCGLPEVKEASALVLGNALRSPTFVTAGDVMWFQTGPATGHCGIIIGVAAGEVACVEGNHGDSARLVRRSLDQVYHATNIPADGPPGVPSGLDMVTAKFAGTR